MRVYMHACMYTCMYVCTRVCVRVCIHVCMYAFVRDRDGEVIGRGRGESVFTSSGTAGRVRCPPPPPIEATLQAALRVL